MKSLALALALAVVLLVVLAASDASGATTYPPDLQAPPITHNPKAYLDIIWPGPRLYNGRSKVDGRVFTVSRDFQFVEVGRVAGTWVQYYSRQLGTYACEYLMDLGGGVDVKVADLTFNQLRPNEFTRSTEFVLEFTPDDLAPDYVQGTPVADNMFYSTYLYRDRAHGPVGMGSRTEFFYFDPTAADAPGLESLNCLFDFNNAAAAIDLMTCFRYTKLSNNPYACDEGDHDREARGTTAAFNRRTGGGGGVNASQPLVNLGKGLVLPVDMVIYPQHRHLFV
jgi:hypothetical protein